LQKLLLSGNQISSFDLTGFEATALTMFAMNDNSTTEVILADAILSQVTFDTLMIGSRDYPSFYPGMAEVPNIARVDFTGADMSGVDQLDEMFAMEDLETLILTDVVFSDAIVAGSHAETWDLICALEAQKLDALTVNQQLYAAMQTNLDTWDAGPNNVLTVIPEPCTLVLLALGGCALLLRRGRTG